MNIYCVLFILIAIKIVSVKSDYNSPCRTINQQPGLCVPVKSCKQIYEIFTRLSQNGGNITEHNKRILSAWHCGTFKNLAHVCCPKTEIQLNAEGVEILKNQTCGTYMFNTVANGHQASLFQYPWMALLKYGDEFDPFKCGGTLISDQYVLTAAHCLKGYEQKLKAVRLGEYQISSQTDCTNVARKNQCAPPVEDIEIEDLIIHEDFKEIYNDIGLIRLNRKVEFKRHIKPICLPIYENLQTKEYDDYIISGWGKTENGLSSDILLSAFLPLVNRLDCENQLRKYNLRSSLNNGHICVGGRNLTDSCRGDSGGPLGYRDFYDGVPRYIQFGIVSIGLRNCGTVNVPGLYTNVSHYMQWITDNVKVARGPTFGIADRSLSGKEK